MSNKCELTGKRPLKGHNVSHANNKTKRKFNHSIKKIKFKSNILKKIKCPQTYGVMTFHRPYNVDRKGTLSELLNTIEK